MVQSPPPYNSLSELLESSDDSASRNHQYPIPANTNPTNNVLISRSNSLEGVWVIDPDMVLPDPPKSPRAQDPETSARNVLLEATQAGNIKADIFIKPRRREEFSLVTTRDQDGRKAAIEASTVKGWVTVRIHDVLPDDGADNRLPIHIHVKAWNDKAYIYLPRSFRGPLRLQTPKSTTFTKAIKSLITPFSEVDLIQNSFLGRFDSYEWKGWEAWSGDKLEVHCNDFIYIYFDDEGKVPTSGDNGGCVSI